MDTREKHGVLFINLVMMFHSLAWQQMGKVKNPATGKIERNLEGASHCIDTLEMLKEKTKTGLAPEEQKFLDEMLKELKLNYVNESAKPSPVTGEEPAKQNDPEGHNE
jgi:hypothetical protein